MSLETHSFLKLVHDYIYFPSSYLTWYSLELITIWINYNLLSSTFLYVSVILYVFVSGETMKFISRDGYHLWNRTKFWYNNGRCTHSISTEQYFHFWEIFVINVSALIQSQYFLFYWKYFCKSIRMVKLKSGGRLLGLLKKFKHLARPDVLIIFFNSISVSFL